MKSKHSKHIATPAFLALLVSGCSGTEYHLRMLEKDGTIRTAMPFDESYDFTFLIENRIVLDWDGDNKEDRKEITQLMFKKQCNNDVKIISETPERKGKYSDNRESTVWVLKVKCAQPIVPLILPDPLPVESE